MSARAVSPTAAILVIGDEILSGRTADSNVNTIARFLGGLGVELCEARVVGDRRDQIVKALNALRFSYTYVFTTGGIGPTHDDITTDCVADAFGAEVVFHPEAVAVLERRYGGELNDARRRMARVPAGAELIRNPVSDAPGFQIGNVFVLAGVPKIMQAMLEDVAPRLQTGQRALSRTLEVRVGEGTVAAPLQAVARAWPSLSLGSYPFGTGTGGFGSQLVVRGRESSAVDAAFEALKRALAEVGVEAVEVVEDAEPAAA